MHDDELSSPAVTRTVSIWWRRPSVISLFTVIVLLSATLGWSFWRGLSAGPGPASETGLPWQVRAAADGSSEVFGLHLGQTTLGEVEARFGDELHVGLITPHGGEPALEAFVDGLRASFISGKLVLAFEAEAGWLQRARARSPGNEVGEGGRSRRYRLAEDDLAQARAARLVALAFLPSLRLDGDMVRQRFGEPAERVSGASGETQWLYPAQGVAIALPPAEGEGAEARAVIQYVAPRDFEARLRAPLHGAAASAPR